MGKEIDVKISKCEYLLRIKSLKHKPLHLIMTSVLQTIDFRNVDRIVRIHSSSDLSFIDEATKTLE